MQRTRPILIAVAILLLATIACNAILPQARTTPPPAEGSLPQTEADVPRVTAEEAKAAVDAGTAIIVDVRDAESYAEGHIAGAMSIPLDQFENDPAALDLDEEQWIITYCT